MAQAPVSLLSIPDGSAVLRLHPRPAGRIGVLCRQGLRSASLRLQPVASQPAPRQPRAQVRARGHRGDGLSLRKRGCSLCVRAAVDLRFCGSGRRVDQPHDGWRGRGWEDGQSRDQGGIPQALWAGSCAHVGGGQSQHAGGAGERAREGGGLARIAGRAGLCSHARRSQRRSDGGPAAGGGDLSAVRWGAHGEEADHPVLHQLLAQRGAE